MAMMAENIFQKILDGEIPAKIVHEDETVVAFRDVNPQAPVHVLIIPRKVIRMHSDVTADDVGLLGAMHLAAQKIAKAEGLESYRLTINCNEGAGQTVPHLHMHLMGGRGFSWPPG